MIDWKKCNYCHEEYAYEHVRCAPAYVGPNLSPQRLSELEEYRNRLERLRARVAENCTDTSYRPVSFGELRLLFYLLDKFVSESELRSVNLKLSDQNSV